MARRKRDFNVFSLAFLDVMSCGFGAVVLIFLIINHSSSDDVKEINRDAMSESRRLDYEITLGQQNRVELIEALEAMERRVAESRNELASMLTILDSRKDELDDVALATIANRESLEALQSDIETRKKDLERLEAQSESSDGNRVREVAGDGDRQYLTGLIIGGDNVLIALDASASMLDSSIVNILRRRNMSEESQRRAPKWRRAVRTVEWLAAQVPPESQMQIMTYNTEVKSLYDKPGWYAATDSSALDAALLDLDTLVPANGTSLEKLFNNIALMNPLPDNVILIVDGLPTQGEKPPRGSTISGRERLRLFRDAMDRLPPQVPVNVILFPMEGDPSASAAFWTLSQTTGGSFLAPSGDWP